MSKKHPQCPHDEGEGECSDCRRLADAWVARGDREEVTRLRSEVASLTSQLGEVQAALGVARKAIETLSVICRGLRKCRHGRTCCQENDNTVGAINAAVNALAALPKPQEKPQ